MDNNSFSWYTIELLENGKFGLFLNNKKDLHELKSKRDTLQEIQLVKEKHENFSKKIGEAIAHAMEKLMAMPENERQEILNKMNNENSKSE